MAAVVVVLEPLVVPDCDDAVLPEPDVVAGPDDAAGGALELDDWLEPDVAPPPELDDEGELAGSLGGGFVAACVVPELDGAALFEVGGELVLAGEVEAEGSGLAG